MRKPNKPLLRRLARKLRRLRHEEHYNQVTWAEKTSCGTAACIAGHAVIEVGCRFMYEKDFTGEPYRYTDYCIKPDSKRTSKVRNVARNILGLTRKQANRLFDDDPGYDCGPRRSRSDGRPRKRVNPRSAPPASRPIYSTQSRTGK